MHNTADKPYIDSHGLLWHSHGALNSILKEKSVSSKYKCWIKSGIFGSTFVLYNQEDLQIIFETTKLDEMKIKIAELI